MHVTSCAHSGQNSVRWSRSVIFCYYSLAMNLITIKCFISIIFKNLTLKKFAALASMHCDSQKDHDNYLKFTSVRTNVRFTKSRWESL